jgi:hypothetical protein
MSHELSLTCICVFYLLLTGDMGLNTWGSQILERRPKVLTTNRPNVSKRKSPSNKSGDATLPLSSVWVPADSAACGPSKARRRSLKAESSCRRRGWVHARRRWCPWRRGCCFPSTPSPGFPLRHRPAPPPVAAAEGAGAETAATGGPTSWRPSPARRSAAPSAAASLASFARRCCFFFFALAFHFVPLLSLCEPGREH